MKLSIKCLGIVASLVALMAAPTEIRADHHEEKANPSGTWTWTREGRDGNQMTSTLKLKADGEKLTGKISGRGDTENDISNGKVDGSMVSFDVTRSFGGNEFTMKYTGKIAGDTLTLTSKFTGRDGQEMSREFTAKRALSLTGDWKSVFQTPDGNSMDIVLALKQDGENVTGMVKVNEFEIPLKGTFKDGALTYTSEWDANGNTMTSKFAGKVAGNKITGKITRNFGDQERTRDVEYTRAD